MFLEYPVIKLQAKRIKLNLFFKLSYMSSNFALTWGYLDLASKNLAQNSRTQVCYVSWGPFLESPGNFLGPKSNIQMEIERIRVLVLASKLLH